MIELGRRQKLKIMRFKSQGAYLNLDLEGNEEGDVLLPKDQVPIDAEVGDEIEVMVYNDSQERVIATTKEAKGQVGEIVPLKVETQASFGTFLDWGLDKDVFLPFSETVGRVIDGEEYLFALYVDKSGRICASMNLQKYLSTDSPYKENEMVTGTIYSINKDIGAFVAVENKYNGLIPNEELVGAYEIGDKLELRVANVKRDGKLDLSLRGRAHNEMAVDVNTVLKKLGEGNGFIPFNDRSDPEDIRKEFGMSKSAFKRATGNLYKERMISFEKNGIKLI